MKPFTDYHKRALSPLEQRASTDAALPLGQDEKPTWRDRLKTLCAEVSLAIGIFLAVTVAVVFGGPLLKNDEDDDAQAD